MQSPLIENISQKVFSSLKQNLEQTFESSLENKENYIPNISSKNHLNLKFETNKAFNRENPQKNAEKFSISKQNLENLETCWNQEIQELIEKIEAFDFNSSKINENFLSFSICTKSEITENSLENKFSQNQQANEASNLNDLSDKIGAENACDLANCLDIERNSSVLDKLENVTEKVKSHSAPYDNENFKEKPKQTSINGLKQHFRSLFFKLEKLLEIQKETKMLNFTETNFSENSEQSNFLFAENKNNILNFNNYNSTNQKNESENSNSNFPLNSLLTKITEICIEKKFFCEIMNFYLRSANEAKAIDLFLIKNIINFHDYEEAVFFLAEDLTRKLSKIELLFQILQFTSQNFVFNLYPVFSVCLHKLVKFNFIQEAFILKNYMLHFKLEISSVALNSLLEALGKSGRLEDAANLIKEIENANFLHFFDSCFTDSNSDLNNKNNFSKLSMQAGLNQISYGILIKHLCKSNLIDTALVHYEYLKANKLIKDEVIFNLLIDGCSKSSNLAQIISIYQDMLDFEIKPSIVTFNTIIDSYVRAKDFISAWNIYEEIKNFGCVPDKFTFSTLFRGIRNLAHKEYLEKAFVLLEELNKSNNSIDVILINVLIDSCIWLKDEKSLVKIFSNAVNGFYKNLSPDIITFNTFIKGCAQLYLFEEAKKAFNILLSKQDSIKPNDVSFNTMIDVYVRSENLNLVWDLLDLMKKYGIKPDNFTYSTIIKGINKKSNFNASNNFNKNLNNYDSDEAELEMAFKLFENVKANSKPDEILYNCIMDACLRFEKIDKMMEYHVEMMKENVKPSSITCGILIKAYGMKGMLEKALEVYENMKSENIEISSITYGCLINACIKNNNLQKFFELYQDLDRNNIEMNTVLYTTMIKAYSKTNNLLKVNEIFEKMKKDKNNLPNNVTYNSVIDCCVKCNNMREAEIKFTEMKFNKIKPDIITFSTLIKGCMKSSLLDKAIDYLHTMINSGIKPDEVLLNSLLDGCEKMNKFTQARDIFLFVRKFGLQPSMMSFSIMMKIYGKLKDFQNSKILLEEIKTRPKNCSLIIFTCFIKTCLQTRNFQEALLTYESLKSIGIQADQITFNTILKGLVINRAYEYIPKIILESLQNNKTLCSNAIYSEALNALSKNLTKAKLTQSDLFEIRRNLAFNNIFVEISNESSYNNNSSHYKNVTQIAARVNNNNYAESGYCNENQSFYSNKNNGESNNRGNFFHKKGKIGNINTEETYVDNYDFLIKGYKNNQKHFNNNNNNNFQQQASITNNSSSKKGIYNQALTFTFDEANNRISTENDKSILEIQNNKIISINNLNEISNADENSIFEKPSLNILAIPIASEIKNFNEENNKVLNFAIDSGNVGKENQREPNKLRERSSFYKNFANFNDISNAVDNFQKEQKNQTIRNLDGLNSEKNSQKACDKIIIKQNVPCESENDKENDTNENYSSNNLKGKQSKTQNISNYTYKKKEELKNHSNNFGNNYNNYSNIPNAKNQIFRKGFNIPIDSITEKVANFPAKYSHTENDENSNSNFNENVYRKTQGKGINNNFSKAGNNSDFNSSQNQQQAAKPFKKLTRF